MSLSLRLQKTYTTYILHLCFLSQWWGHVDIFIVFLLRNGRSKLRVLLSPRCEDYSPFHMRYIRVLNTGYFAAFEVTYVTPRC